MISKENKTPNAMIILNKVLNGRFVERPNKFIVIVELEGKGKVKAFLPDPGRLTELLLPGARVFLGKVESTTRKTMYDMVAVRHGGTIVSVDTRVPNKFVGELLKNHYLFDFTFDSIKPEYTYGDSRLDFHATRGNKEYLMEVKSVTLVMDGNVGKFPDAPTKRGARHLRELTKAVGEGYEAWIIFAAQRDDVESFEPNTVMDPEFSSALKDALDAGVKAIAFSSRLFIDNGMLKIEPAMKNIPIVI
ncbi:MAG: DNA/RNA nuclease SfsA [Promethearchaeota archaeon]